MNAQEPITKTTGQILKDNICTLFNLFNFLIAVALACVGAWTNLFFILIIILNVVIGIAQELKAKKLVEELSLLTMPMCDVIRRQQQLHISIQEVEKGDILLLESGKQICADSTVISGELEVNESLLTGESDPVIKKPGDSLLSGSSVISGKCQAEIIHVGDENYASQIANEVKKLKQVNSELLLSMRKVTRFTSWFIIPLGILLFLEAFFLRGEIMYDAVVSTAAGLLGMLPKGLVLLISIGLAAGIIRLSKQNVLVQDLYSLENLAHVDVICLDKTGTLTQGRMQVEQAIVLDSGTPVPFETMMGAFLCNTDDNNATFQAMKEYFQPVEGVNAPAKIPFSSERKWSAVTLDGIGTLVVGAPERLCKGKLPEVVTQVMKEGKRVLLSGLTDEIENKTLDPDKIRMVAAIVITDPLRENAASSISYFRNQGVAVKVISGDNPVMVSAVAKQAGIEHAENYVDMSMIRDEEMDRVVQEYTVFGRVSPQQKKLLVTAMQKQGHRVAMTGDGVNDLLAMKQADCSIAVGQGSDAAKQTAQLVLIDSDFSVLRSVLAEGRRVVNNITKSAGVFFIKTIYSVLLCLVCIILNMDFPFLPIQITLIDLVIEGYPAFFISFEPNDKRITGRFLPTALRLAAPNAIVITLSCIAVFLLNWLGAMPLDAQQQTLLMYLVVGTIGIAAVWKSCWPLNKLRGFLAITTTIGFYVAVLLFHNLLQLALPVSTTIWMLLIFAAVGILLERLLALLIRKKFTKPSPLAA